MSYFQQLEGNVSTLVSDSTAIFASSRGDAGSGDLRVTVRNGNVISGADNGTGNGVGFDGGASNTLLNRGFIGTVDGVAGLAIKGTSGNEQIDNFGTVTGTLTYGTVAGMEVDLDRWSSGLEVVGSAPVGALSLALPMGLGDSYLSAGYEVGASHIDMMGATSEIHSVTHRGTSILTLALSQQLLEQRGGEAVEMLLERATGGHWVQQADPAGSDELRRWGTRLLQLLKPARLSLAARKQLLDETQRIITSLALPGDRPAGMTIRRRYQLSQRARDYMLDRVNEPPTIIELCRALHTSERTLHHVFRDIYGVPPKHFLKARRLFAARRLLLAAPPQRTISEIAMDLGFFDLGRFAHDYRTMFGELPSQILARR